jgi:flagellar protein FlgJ
MTAPVSDPKFFADFAGLASLRRDAQAQDRGALREAARQFESIFAKMMLSSMRAASFGDSLLGSDQQDFYQGMFDDQMAVELTRGKGLGLADMLVQQLTRAGLASPPPAPSPRGEGVGNSRAGDSSVGEVAVSARRVPGAVFPETAAPPAQLSPLQQAAAEVAQAINAGPVITAGAELPVASAGAARSFWRPQSKEEFIRELWPCAQQAGRELGIDPKHLLAQAALETGWGQSLPCDTDGSTSFNLFGIKAGSSWGGNSVAVRTLEFEGGVAIQKRERFRAYDSAAESFRDYVALLRDNPRYSAALNTGGDANAFAGALQRGGYATDPAYARKIASIAQNLDTAALGLKSDASTPITRTGSL